MDRLLFRPYLWGGNDPMAGFDCSGFVVEVLKSVGILPAKGDWTAAQLKDMFASKVVSTTLPGTLVFWGSPPTHVEMAYDTGLTIGASGGGSGTTSLADAIEQDAYIKIRPIKSGYTFLADPF